MVNSVSLYPATIHAGLILTIPDPLRAVFKGLTVRFGFEVQLTFMLTFPYPVTASETAFAFDISFWNMFHYGPPFPRMLPLLDVVKTIIIKTKVCIVWGSSRLKTEK
jgi:hypothetical protein